MSRWNIGQEDYRRIRPGFDAGGCSGWVRRVDDEQDFPQHGVVSSEYLPETDLASQIERDLLNARINFIYFVTVQKEGALEKGWQRFRSAQQEIPKLQDLVSRSDNLADIRPAVEQLNRDFNGYVPVLKQIIDAVQRKQN